jgi:hypothetical protein
MLELTGGGSAMSSTRTARQFQSWVGRPSNIDKCARCQLPRPVHGPDWTCPSRGRNRALAPVMLSVGAILVVAGVVLRLIAPSAPQGQAMMMADAVVLGILLMVAGFVLLGRPD